MKADHFIMLRSLAKEDFHPSHRYGGVLWKHNKKWVMVCTYDAANENHHVICRAINAADDLACLFGLAEVVDKVRGECGEYFEPYFRITEHGREFLARCNRQRKIDKGQEEPTPKRPKRNLLGRFLALCIHLVAD